MALLDDIAQARNEVQSRVNRIVDSARQTHGVTYDNIDRLDTWDGRFAGADKERLAQLDLLSQAISDPSWTATLDREVEARRTAGNTQADAGFRQAEDRRRVAAARSGMAAGGNDAAVEAENRQRVAAAKARVAQQVDELRAAGVQNLEEMGRQLLARALAGPDEAMAMGIGSAGFANERQTNALGEQNAEQYRGLLANTLAGFLGNTVTPAVQMGFQSADRWNQMLRDDYWDARMANTTDAKSFSDWLRDTNMNTRSWWSW